MARVIVILALMLLISALIFGLTRKQGAGGTAGADAEAHATVPLAGGTAAASPSGASGLSAGNEKPASDVQTAQDVLSGLASGAAPAFSTVGVDNRGRASFTGTASPGDEVSLVHDGKRLGSGITDHTGNWTIDFRVPAVREDFALALSARRNSGQTVSSPQRAIVSPPESAGGLQHITLETIPSETKPGAPAAASEPDVGIVIEKVDAEKDGTAVLKGKSDPGATVRALIDGKVSGETKVAADGKWILAVRNVSDGPSSGVLLVLSSVDGHELDRAEVPLKLAGGGVKTAEHLPPAASGVAATGVAATIAATSIQTSAAPLLSGKGGQYVKVRRGDSLWRIARRHYGNGRRWTRIYNANKRKIQDPDFLKPGRRIFLPG